MIFLTVGHQTPFDLLVRSVDEWATSNSSIEIFAQIGEGQYEPKNMEYAAWLSAEAFAEKLQRAEAVISHAGTGTIIQVLSLNKPLLVLPRKASLHETRNDHQWGTARHFAEQGYLIVANDEGELDEKIKQLGYWSPSTKMSDHASAELIGRISQFIDAC